MFSTILAKIFGTKSGRDLKKIQPLVERTAALEGEMGSLSLSELSLKTGIFRERLKSGESLEDLLPEAFATAREVSRRVIGLRHFDVQILGGIILHQGKIAEMKTGEGKTLVATLPLYLNALSGEGVHLVTVNDYLAKRDAVWMGPVYHALGLSVGVIQHWDSEGGSSPGYLFEPGAAPTKPGMEHLRPCTRHEAYRADVVYVTNNEIGFDYLRDNMVIDSESRVLRKLNFAIVDEVDSILVDEARTPLIISGPAEESTDKYYLINRTVPHLKGRFVTEAQQIDAKYKGEDLSSGFDYIVDEKAHSVTLTEQGQAKCEKLLGVKNLYDDISGEWVHHITQALRARNLYKRDVHYVVKEGEVIIVDENTGRLMPGRRWSEGLHQAVEAKENLRIAEENQTLATITFQNFFRLYKKLAGMTGTAMTEAGEFWEIYKQDVVEIPTNMPMIRRDSPDVVFKSEREKFEAILSEIEELHRQGQPVLVGTRSIEKSETLAAMLKRKGIPHQVLNAKYHEQEAQIIAQAGRKGAVTIATNMAGRGTDIVLGGNPPDSAEAEKIKTVGGVHVLGTERHESRRIDNQLRGRTGRQGDPGSSRFYLALDDELLRLFGGEKLSRMMDSKVMEAVGGKWQEGESIESPFLSKQIESAQRRVEAMHFDIRKNLLEYDNVMNKQREAVYALRNSILEGTDISEKIQEMLEESKEEMMDLYAPKKAHPEEYDLEQISLLFRRFFAADFSISQEALSQMDRRQFEEHLREAMQKAYQAREAGFGKELMRDLERRILLQVMDASWKDHLYDLDQLRKGIGLRAYGQKDPLVEYQRESRDLFFAMMDRIRQETVEYLFRVQIMREPFGRVREGGGAPARAGGGAPRGPSPALAQAAGQMLSRPVRIGRNDPCSCGSGKKYKKCCGR